MWAHDPTHGMTNEPTEQQLRSLERRRWLQGLSSFMGCFAMTAPGATHAAESAPSQTLFSSNQGLPDFHASLRSRMHFSHGWHSDVSDPVAWRTAGRAQARSLILPQGVDATPTQWEVLEQSKRGNIVAELVAFNLTQDCRVKALLLRPASPGPHPAALMLHDHGSRFDIGKEKMVRPWCNPEREQAAEAWSHRFYGGRFPGDELARRGYIVLSVDALGWGDRRINGFSYESQQALASNLMNLGTSWAGVMAHDDMRAARVLSRLEGVDASRLAAVGFSMGAFRAWQLSALSDDVTATIASCWMATMQGLMEPGNNQLRGQSAFAMLHPGIARALDYPDVAGLAAPKPLLLQAGEQDTLFPRASVERAFAQLQAIWSAHRAPELLDLRWWPQGHHFDKSRQDASFDWLTKQFSL